MLLEIEKQFLLKIARDSLRAALTQTESSVNVPVTEAVLKLRGAFVTLRNGDELRGCIGYADPLHPLIETVSLCAVKAATEDFRFQPLKEIELQSITIEISVLSEMKPVSHHHEIIIGEHGVMLRADSRRGLLLPQVAVQHGWDQITFLQHVAQKAGLAPDAWNLPGVQLFTFTAEVFQENVSTGHEFDSQHLD